MADIARKAGVSRPTASLILLGKGERYAVDTRRRVREAAKELGYRSNILAHSFRQQRSYLVGVLCSGVNYLFNTGLQRGIQSELVNRSLAPVSFTHTSPQEEMECIQACLDRAVDGLIANAAVDNQGHSNSDYYADLIGQGTAIVEVMGNFIPGAPSVIFDYRSAGRLAVKELLHRGHERIALFTHESYRASEETPGLFWNAQHLWEGYSDAISVAGKEPIPITYELGEDLSNAEAVAEAITRGVHSVFEHQAAPTAVLCLAAVEANAMFVDAIKRRSTLTICTAISQGLLPSARDETIALKFPTEEVGRLAVELVCRLREGDTPESIALPPVVAG